jgi:tetratricopeptide (TPR) repeat protein
MTEPLALLQSAITLQQAGQLEAAVANYDQLLAGYIGTAQVHTNRGLALFELGRTQEAIAAYDAALTFDMGYVDAHYSRGLALFVQKQFAQALASFDAAIAIAPSADAYVSRGSTYMELAKHSAALLDYDAALHINPNFAKAHMNKGAALYELEQLDAALACFERALAINPSHHSTEWNMALCLLRAGNLERGWPLYERRLEGTLSEPLRRASYGKPRVLALGRAADGTFNLRGKTILVWPEQGHGDVMQFCRYAHVLLQMGAHVILEVYAPLLRLMQASFAGTAIRVALDGTTDASEFDCHTPLLSLPLICGTDSLDKISATTPYLFAVPQAVQTWQERWPHASLRVGLVWAGGHRPNQPIDAKVDAARSLHLEAFVPLLALSQTMNVQFFSLQLDEPAKQLQAMQDLPITDLTAHLHDWADTAALVANLDLVISCDTAVAHLAAAMGKPTWVLARLNGCWRWLQDRDDSPWYPTVRLFRQAARGDWGAVIAKVVAALEAKLAP